MGAIRQPAKCCARYRHPSRLPRSPRPQRTIAAALVLTGALPAAAPAQDAAGVLPDIVVTATRVATPVERVGSAISVVTGEQIERQQIRRVEDALRLVPGVTVTRQGSIGRPTGSICAAWGSATPSC